MKHAATVRGFTNGYTIRRNTGGQALIFYPQKKRLQMCSRFLSRTRIYSLIKE